MKLSRILSSCLLAGAAGAIAAPVTPTSYDMRNGDGQASGGTFNYWDRFYSGAGATTTDGAALSGGLGDLTDGVVASDLWLNVENGSGTGPYVGWVKRNGADPTVVFSFGGSPLIEQIEVHVDNSNIGGVFAFTGIEVDGTLYTPATPADGTIGWVTITGLSLSGGSHSLKFLHESFDSWIFISEVRFSGQPDARIPEPGSLALIALGLAAVGATGRRART